MVAASVERIARPFRALGNDSSWIAASTSLRYAAQFLILWSVTWRFGAAGGGSYAIAIAICSPVFVVLGLGLRNLYFTAGAGMSTNDFRRTRVVAYGVAAATSVVIAAVTPRVELTVVAAVAVGKWLDGVVDLESAVLQEARLTRRSARAYSAQAIGALLGVAVCWTTGANLIISASLPVVISGITASTTARMTTRGLGRVPHEKHTAPIRNLAKAGLPVGIAFGVIGLLNTVPQYVLHARHMEADVARYAALLYLATVFEVLLNARMHARLGRHGRGEAPIAPGTQFAIHTGVAWAKMTIPAGVLGVLFYWIAAPYVFGSEFSLSFSAGLMVLVLSMLLPMAFSVGVTLNVARAYGEQPIINGIALATTTTGALILTSVSPISGALLAVCAGQLVRVVGGLLVLARIK